MPRFPSSLPGFTAEKWLRNALPFLREAARGGRDTLRGLLSILLQGEAAVWLGDLPDEFSLEEFEALFQDRFGGTVRFRPQEARQALYENRVVQRKHDSVGSYYTKFMDVVRQAEDMSVSDQISWFIHGLHPNLLATCAVQPNGHPWHDLKALLNFALGEEARLKATKAATHRAQLSRIARAQAGGNAGTSTPRQGGGTPARQGGEGSSKRPAQGPPKASGPPTKKKAGPFDPNNPPWGPPEAENARNRSITNREACERMNHGRCLYCNKAQGHASGCPKERRHQHKKGQDK